MDRYKRLYEMSNYRASQTRLPCDIYISQKGAGFPGDKMSPHSIRIKVFSGERGEPDVTVNFQKSAKDFNDFIWIDPDDDVQNWERNEISKFIIDNMSIIVKIWEKELADNELLDYGLKLGEFKLNRQLMRLPFRTSIYARVTSDNSRPYVEILGLEHKLRINIKNPYIEPDSVLTMEQIETYQKWINLNKQILLDYWQSGDKTILNGLIPIS